MRIGVIGAGAAGLAVGRMSLEEIPAAHVTILEQSDGVGGTWVYADNPFEDQYGLPTHSSMYKSLRTNLPKETMEFFGFPYDEKHSSVSYLDAQDIVEYLEQYADHFQLKKNIKFRHHVTSVKPLPEARWEVVAKDLIEDEEKQFEFDTLFVCNGHLHRPNLISIEGQNVFKGHQLHSHHYRKPEPYKNQKVLVIGSGPSGMDISKELASVAECVYLSHHDRGVDSIVLPKKVIKKPDVRNLSEESVEFVDGSVSSIDSVLYCTGYKINMPFLSPECGLEVSDDSVDPLFLHMVNINCPTMFFIGLINRSFLFPIFEMQAQFCLRIVNGSVKLPTKGDLLKSWTAESMEVKLKKRKPHFIGDKMKEYHDFIHDFANTYIYDPVTIKVYEDSGVQKKVNFLNYRDHLYILIDRENYLRKSVKDSS